jgi:hypothetical protein
LQWLGLIFWQYKVNAPSKPIYFEANTALQIFLPLRNWLFKNQIEPKQLSYFHHAWYASQQVSWGDGLVRP